MQRLTLYTSADEDRSTTLIINNLLIINTFTDRESDARRVKRSRSHHIQSNPILKAFVRHSSLSPSKHHRDTPSLNGVSSSSVAAPGFDKWALKLGFRRSLSGLARPTGVYENLEPGVVRWFFCPSNYLPGNAYLLALFQNSRIVWIGLRLPPTAEVQPVTWMNYE